MLTDILEPPMPKADMCSCSNCGWKGKCSDCEQKEESEGWEYPTYWIHLCPICEDGGCVDDYWFSADAEDELNDIMAEGFLDKEV